jgi:hypothetical protein
MRINEDISNYEKERAIMEASMISVMDAFFSARPHFYRTSGTMNCSEKLFEAAFMRGWDMHKKELNG